MLTGKTHHPRDLTPSHEHYLRALWDVRAKRGYARLTDVARALDVSAATLSEGLKPLEARGFVAHDDARFLLLTPAGERVARELHHRHAVVRAFLADVLGVPAGTAENEACLLEHGLGAATTDRLVTLLRLLREDAEVRSLLESRLRAHRRTCRPRDACATCGLACLTAAPH